MIKRIVMMELLPGTESHFLEIFNLIKSEIRSHEGCLSLELLRSSGNSESTICTISLWKTIDDLETYRTSALFQSTWSQVKPYFASRARAWTLTTIESVS